MVGVPGRSKGYHTCKQRRIKCTEERPQCCNCIKSNRMCGGYLRKHAFILYQETKALDPAPPQPISEDSESGALMVARWRVDPSKPSQPFQRTMKNEVALPWRQCQYRTNLLPPHVSSRQAGVQQILGIFLTDHLPSEAVNERYPIVTQRHWMLEIQESLILTSALESSFLAVCLAKLGRKYDDKALVCEALSMYTRGLSQLRQALRNPRTRCHDETLATCLALMQFESTECPARSVESCTAHYKGAMNLLLLRSPEEYASGLGRCMYQQLRISSVFQGIHLHTRTFLADAQWRELPWGLSQKSLRDLLIDIVLEMPEIYHRHDKLLRETCRSKVLPHLINIVDLCWQLDSQLSEWYSCFETFVSGPVYWPELSMSDSSVDDPKSGKVFAVSFYFPSSDVAQMMILYWLALLLVHPILCWMYERLESVVGEQQGDTECSCIEGLSPETAEKL